MPTAYTAPVNDGSITTLRGYALRCARAMGALISMRDEPLDAPLPTKLTPSSWNADKLAECRQRLAELRAMTNAEKKASAKKWNAENEVSRQRALSKNARIRANYEAMTAKVEAWDGGPEGLKSFMLEQLRQSLDFDVSDDPLRYYPASRSVDEWFDAELKETLRQIEYHDKENRAEVERVAERQAWLDQLRSSLQQEEADHA